MKYKARDNIYHDRYYLKDKLYSESEIPNGLSEKELNALFEPIGIPGKSPVDSGITVQTEHEALIEFASENKINASSKWKPETIIKKLEEAGVTGDELERFKSIDWTLEVIGE